MRRRARCSGMRRLVEIIVFRDADDLVNHRDGRNNHKFAAVDQG
jgi:hypothetical protein